MIKLTQLPGKSSSSHDEWLLGQLIFLLTPFSGWLCNIVSLRKYYGYISSCTVCAQMASWGPLQGHTQITLKYFPEFYIIGLSEMIWVIVEARIVELVRMTCSLGSGDVCEASFELLDGSAPSLSMTSQGRVFLMDDEPWQTCCSTLHSPYHKPPLVPKNVPKLHSWPRVLLQSSLVVCFALVELWKFRS